MAADSTNGKRPGIPQGNFEKFRDLVSEVMTRAGFDKKVAIQLGLDCLLMRHDLMAKFGYAFIKAGFQKAIEALYEPSGLPRRRIRPHSTTEGAPVTADEEESGIAAEACDLMEDLSPEEMSVFTGEDWDAISVAVEGVEDQETAEERPVSPQARFRQEHLWNPAWRALAVAMDEPLLDGTRMGDATRPQLLTNATHAGLRQTYYELVADCLPDETKRVADHLTEETLHRLRAQAQREIGAA